MVTHAPDDTGSAKTTGLIAAVTALALVAPGVLGAHELIGPDTPEAVEAENLALVGHSPLQHRGLNSALAVDGDVAYVGYRGDGTHAQAGIAIVDISDPTDPTLTSIFQPDEETEQGESSRELRIWPQQDLLIVLDFHCDPVAHACYGSAHEDQGPEYNLYDISGEKRWAPELVHAYTPSREPHEFFLWIDPAQPADRALVFMSTPSGDGDNLLVADISQARQGVVEEVASWHAGVEDTLHSVSVTPAGDKAWLAYSSNGVMALDVAQLTAGQPDPDLRLITDPEDAPTWGSPGAHSAVKVPGRDLVWTTDESYGWYFALERTGAIGFEDVIVGCPWTWARTLDASEPSTPTVLSEFKIAENDPSFCDTPQGVLDSNTTSYSSHNPTLTEHLAINTWYAGGVVVADTSDPAAPEQAGQFVPQPIPISLGDDPAVTYGTAKVAMWSYPVVQDGLIYAVDIRNGLYVLDYTGPHAEEVHELSFLEGNSNRGDAIGLGAS